MTLTLPWQAFALVVGHFALDYPLQGDTTAREKNPNSTTPLQAAVPWWYWMTAHALMHAAAVAAITGSGVFAAIEFVVHFALDYAKCQGWISIHTDQACHLLTKGVFLWASV